MNIMAMNELAAAAEKLADAITKADADPNPAPIGRDLVTVGKDILKAVSDLNISVEPMLTEVMASKLKFFCEEGDWQVVTISANPEYVLCTAAATERRELCVDFHAATLLASALNVIFGGHAWAPKRVR